MIGVATYPDMMSDPSITGPRPIFAVVVSKRGENKINLA